MQVWFFQKRRIVRLLDKVLDKEFNMNRVEEFSALVERRLCAFCVLLIAAVKAGDALWERLWERYGNERNVLTLCC
jgi:hypothetical protein